MQRLQKIGLFLGRLAMTAIQVFGAVIKGVSQPNGALPPANPTQPPKEYRP